jgi:hypothetical protein
MSSKGKIYKTKITPKAAMYGAIPLTSALVLAHFALDAARKFHPSDPTRLLFVGIPALLSAVIVVSLLITTNHFLNRTVGIRDKELLYKDGKKMLSLGVAEMAFSPPSDKALLKTIMFSDGVNFIQMPEIFMGREEFNELLEAIEKQRRVEDLSGQKTWSL